MNRLACSFALLLAAGCGDDLPDCVEVTTDCSPLYQPTFDNIFSRTLEVKCGIAGPCHNAGAAQAGLVYEEADQSYELLLGVGGEARVVPGDPSCSKLAVRVESADPAVQMPPGSPLPEAERCAIVQWIESGAER